MKKTQNNENILYEITNALLRRFIQKLKKALKNETKNWTPFEGVPESIPIGKIDKVVVAKN